MLVRGVFRSWAMERIHSSLLLLFFSSWRDSPTIDFPISFSSYVFCFFILTSKSPSAMRRNAFSMSSTEFAVRREKTKEAMAAIMRLSGMSQSVVRRIVSRTKLVGPNEYISKIRRSRLITGSPSRSMKTVAAMSFSSTKEGTR